MWITNTATTAMMVPIAEAVLQELKAEHLDKENNDEDQIELTSPNDANVADTEKDPIAAGEATAKKDELAIQIEPQHRYLN